MLLSPLPTVTRDPTISTPFILPSGVFVFAAHLSLPLTMTLKGQQPGKGAHRTEREAAADREREPPQFAWLSGGGALGSDAQSVSSLVWGATQTCPFTTCAPQPPSLQHKDESNLKDEATGVRGHRKPSPTPTELCVSGTFYFFLLCCWPVLVPAAVEGGGMLGSPAVFCRGAARSGWP